MKPAGYLVRLEDERGRERFYLLDPRRPGLREIGGFPRLRWRWVLLGAALPWLLVWLAR